MRLRGLADELQEAHGMQMMDTEGLPRNDEELEQTFKTYKDKAEHIMTAAIKWLAAINDWDYERFALFRDIVIAGRCFSKSEIVNGRPHTRRIDPRFMIFDHNATNDFLSDATYFGEVRYMSIGQAATEYDLSRKEIKEIYESYKVHQKSVHAASQRGKTTGSVAGGTLEFFREDRGELRVLVLYATWRDYKVLSHKESTDKYGNLHFKKVSDGSKSATSRKTIEVWRHGTLLGGRILKEWGEIPNQVRSVDNLSLNQCPYQALIPNYLNGIGLSVVNQLQSLQDLKDIYV